MSELIQLMQSNAMILVVIGYGFFNVLVALHKIDKRLVKVETLLDPKLKEDEK